MHCGRFTLALLMAWLPRMKNILLAEDDLDTRRILQRFLQQNDYHVLPVAEGTEALAALTQVRFTAALLDVRMPGMNGIDVVIAYRAREHDGHLPMLALTADVTSDTRQRCVEAGFDYCINKPVLRDDLLNILARAVSGDELPVPRPQGAAPHLRPSPAVLDEALVNNVFAVYRGEIGSYYRRYLETADDVLLRMRSALDQSNFPEILELAHRLEGTSSFMGALQVMRCCSAFRQVADTASPDAIRQLIANLQLSIGEARSGIAVMLPTITGYSLS